jgi:hypothetical protein
MQPSLALDTSEGLSGAPIASRRQLEPTPSLECSSGHCVVASPVLGGMVGVRRDSAQNRRKSEKGVYGTDHVEDVLGGCVLEVRT